MAFYDRPDCIRLSKFVDEYGTESGIFLFKNAFPEDLVKSIELQLNAENEEDFTYDDTLISWYSDKLSPAVRGLHQAWEIIGDILGPEWVIHPQNNVLTVRPGHGGMFIHSDSPGKNQCNLLSQVDVWSTCCVIDYGVVAYFGEWEGGAVFYPGIDPETSLNRGFADNDNCFEYKPERGDIVIHSAFAPYNHGVREVTSGVRYAFSNFSLKAIDNPGTFHNYNSPEYIAQIGDKSAEAVSKWMNPLRSNPQFSDADIKIMKDSGLEGEDLAEKFFAPLAATTGVCACGQVH